MGIFVLVNILVGGYIFLDKRMIFLVVIDIFFLVVLLKFFVEDFCFFDLDKFFVNYKFMLFEEGDGIGVGFGGVEIIRGFLVEFRVVVVEYYGVE